MHTSPQDRNRVYTVAGIALALFLGALDQTIVSTALPRIVADLGGLDRYSWVATVYLLVSTLLVPLVGKLSDIVSRKTLELWAVVIFLVGSVLCGTAGEWGTLPLLGDGMTQLVLFRGIQGVGGAGLFALSFIIISDLFPPRERGKVGGVFGAVFGLSSVLGPLIGGFLTDNAGAWITGIEGWRWVFYVNVPLGAVALWFIATRMPRFQPAGGHKLDVVSVLLLMASFFPLVLALQLDKTQHPWISPEVLLLLLGGAALFVVWILHSRRSEHPILDLSLFRDPIFRTGVIASFFFGAAFLAILIFLPLYMVNVQGVSATGAGASVIPLTLGVVLGAGVGGWLSSKLGRYKSILLAGAAAILGGTLLITAFAVGTPLWLILTAMVMTGIGFGPAQSLYALAIQNAVDPGRLGQATSFAQFSRQIGSTIGAAVAGALFSATIAAVAPAGAHHTLSQGEMHQGLQGIRAEIARQFDAVTAKTEALLDLRGDEARDALTRFLADDNVPAELKDQFRNGTPAMTAASGTEAAIQDATVIAQAKVRSEMVKAEDQAADDAVAQLSSLFSRALIPVWWFNVALGISLVVATAFIPGLPLKGRGPAPAEV